jgi:hypothetical protein
MMARASMFRLPMPASHIPLCPLSSRLSSSKDEQFETAICDAVFSEPERFTDVMQDILLVSITCSGEVEAYDTDPNTDTTLFWGLYSITFGSLGADGPHESTTLR